MTETETMSAKETKVPKMTSEDYLVIIMEEILRNRQMEVGRVERLMGWEGDLAASSSVRIEADFPHDAWVVTIRDITSGVIRIWPGGTPPALGAIEIVTTQAVRLKSTSAELNIYNPSLSVAVHYFVYALSLAELEYYKK